ncbi:hypothetical protein [Octadecabacter ascidiaceicola]|uniref:FlgN protein n=1 Tax=Octadecabacter ascidiaceicola TaxID=1655543 RepID=A0A238KDQ2_9RHOB|nr:hypothetical protein [Octadecabacter ascidiaceicola]SMX40302.1 FlgN protein [Octadecabacter ascidiaceicola]
MTNAVDRLARLLEVERLALLNGDFDAVNGLVAEKEKLSSQFNDANARELRLLSVALAHNSSLFAAAREGVTTVVTTLRQQHAARTTLSSYDSSGKATQISQPERSTERRY